MVWVIDQPVRMTPDSLFRRYGCAPESGKSILRRLMRDGLLDRIGKSRYILTNTARAIIDLVKPQWYMPPADPTAPGSLTPKEACIVHLARSYRNTTAAATAMRMTRAGFYKVLERAYSKGCPECGYQLGDAFCPACGWERPREKGVTGIHFGVTGIHSSVMV